MNRMPNGEAVMGTGRRNRIFVTPANAALAIFQVTETAPFIFATRMFATTAANMTTFLQAHYNATASFQAAANRVPVGGMWTASDPKATLPFLLPLEPTYRDFLEVST